MFRMTSFKFRLYYYLSSLLVSTTIFVLYIGIMKLEKSPELLNNLTNITNTKVSFIALIVIWIISLFSLIRFKCMLKTSLDFFKSNRSLNKFKLTSTFNFGFRDFLLSVILPLTFTFSFEDAPITSVIMFILLNLTIYFFYKNSSDFFPNLPLAMFPCGYSIVSAVEIVSDGQSEPRNALIFIKTNKINALVNTEQYISYLEGTNDTTKNIGIVKTEK